MVPFITSMCVGRGVRGWITVSSRQVCSFSSQTDRRILKEWRLMARPPINKLLATSFTILHDINALIYIDKRIQDMRSARRYTTIYDYLLCGARKQRHRKGCESVDQNIVLTTLLPSICFMFKRNKGHDAHDRPASERTIFT